MAKNMEKPIYFLRIEVAYEKKGLFFSQKKYVLDLLQEIDLLGWTPVNTSTEVDVEF